MELWRQIKTGRAWAMFGDVSKAGASEDAEARFRKNSPGVAA
jgi:hypothetical protein